MAQPAYELDEGDGYGYSGGNSGTGTATYPPVVTTSALPSASIGTAYAQQLAAVYGTGNYTWSLTAGTLPAGLALSAAGLISGTPTAAGTSAFVVKVTDSAGSTGSANLSIAVPSQPTIANSSLPAGTVGVPYTAAMIGTGGASPYTYTVAGGALPAGLTLASTGGITGTPTTAGTFPVIIQITDSGSPKGSSTTTFNLAVQRSSIMATVKSLDSCVLLGCADGALYLAVPGQKHDEDYNGTAIPFVQEWLGVPTSTNKLGLMRLGGCTVSAKGSGLLQVSAISDEGTEHFFTSDTRQMKLSGVEQSRDFLGKAVPKSTRFAPRLTNGGKLDAWFEAHVLMLWMQPYAAQRKG